MSSLPDRRESPRVPPPQAPRSWSVWWLMEMFLISSWALYCSVNGYWAAFAFMLLFGLYWAKNGDLQ